MKLNSLLKVIKCEEYPDIVELLEKSDTPEIFFENLKQKSEHYSEDSKTKANQLLKYKDCYINAYHQVNELIDNTELLRENIKDKKILCFYTDDSEIQQPFNTMLTTAIVLEMILDEPVDWEIANDCHEEFLDDRMFHVRAIFINQKLSTFKNVAYNGNPNTTHLVDNYTNIITISANGGITSLSELIKIEGNYYIVPKLSLISNGTVIAEEDLDEIFNESSKSSDDMETLVRKLERLRELQKDVKDFFLNFEIEVMIQSGYTEKLIDEDLRDVESLERKLTELGAENNENNPVKSHYVETDWYYNSDKTIMYNEIMRNVDRIAYSEEDNLNDLKEELIEAIQEELWEITVTPNISKYLDKRDLSIKQFALTVILGEKFLELLDDLDLSVGDCKKILKADEKLRYLLQCYEEYDQYAIDMLHKEIFENVRFMPEPDSELIF